MTTHENDNIEKRISQRFQMHFEFVLHYFRSNVYLSLFQTEI